MHILIATALFNGVLTIGTPTFPLAEPLCGG
jgi:hypothetical protein